MTKHSRILFAAAAVLLLGAFAFPLWRIDLIAPQYPEGLGMLIKVNTVTGIKPNDLANINGLNHYIGMKAIEPDAIPELRVMPWILAGLAALGMIGAIAGSRKTLYVWLAAFMSLGAVGLVDFWRWTYDYGHNLDYEHAIIKVPGMTYQPPIIGTKQLLNFTAASWPALGTAFLGVAFGLGVAALFVGRRTRATSRAATVALAAAACAAPGPRDIAYGHDACDYCRMTISDERYGGQLITTKGKHYAFDSIECMVSFYSENRAPTDGATLWVSDYATEGTWIPVERAVFAESKHTRSPMGLNIVGYEATADTAVIHQQLGTGDTMSWAEVLELVRGKKVTGDVSDALAQVPALAVR